MNYFLMLVILGLAGGGYYEYTIFQKQITDDGQQTAGLQTKVDSLSADNQKLETDNSQLKKSATEAETEIADLTQQLQTAQTDLAVAKQTAAPPPITTPAPANPAPAPAASNDLGNITTLDGKSYQNCQLLKVQADGIVVNNTVGITQVPFGLMPPDLQKRFGFDPKVAATLTPDQVEALEAKRKAAGGT